MKISTHHKTHGLHGTIKLNQTGESLHFFLPSNTTKLAISGEFGGHQFNGQLELIPRQNVLDNDPLDCAIVLVIPFGTQVPLVQKKDPFADHPALRTELNSVPKNIPLQPILESSVAKQPNSDELKTKTAKFDEILTIEQIANPATRVNPLNPDMRSFSDLQQAPVDFQREPVYLTEQEIREKSRAEFVAMDKTVNSGLLEPLHEKKDLEHAEEQLVNRTFKASDEPNWQSRVKTNTVLTTDSSDKSEESVLSLFVPNTKTAKKAEKVEKVAKVENVKTVKPQPPRATGK